MRNITASETAGIDIDEPFDVSPYADAMFRFFLRNPVNQEMGRKFKISFSSSDADTALSYIHDLGFIPKVRGGERGFKVLLGGGLGSQPRHADVLYEFLEADKIIPVTEGVLRIFDRHGERSRRQKARMKFLIKEIGLEAFVKLVEEEQKSLSTTRHPISTNGFHIDLSRLRADVPEVTLNDIESYEKWKSSNVIKQKQEGFFAIGIRVALGDFYTYKARKLANLVKKYAANELRLTLRQDILIRHVKEELLPYFYLELQELGFTDLGYNSTLDITACPGTDTCNLGIASSTGISSELEKVLKEEYPQYINNKNVTIKISGCMNACGQHNMAHIGFQGMSIKAGKLVAPALQVLLGGGVLGDGKGRFADKVLKVPSKRGPDSLRYILNDFEVNNNDENFLEYYDRQGEKYFYELLKPLANIENLVEDDFIDWGHEKPYIKAVGVGECAGVVIDLIATLLFESEEKIEGAKEAFGQQKWADSIYHSYTSIVNTAKALLLSENKKTNTHAGIIKDFDEVFVATGNIVLEGSFSDCIYQINQNEPSETFAIKYLQDALDFYQKVDAFRKKELEHAS